MQHELEDLVERTGGPQPWRRLFHVANGLLLAAALTLLRLPPPTVVVILGVILAILVTIDIVRLRSPDANRAFYTAFRHLLSPRDARGPASSTWYALGVMLALAFLPLEASLSGVLVLALADPAASFGGRRWGRLPFLGASLEGSLIFLATALAVLLTRHPARIAIPAALVVTVAERVSWPLDDNLTIPVVGGVAVVLLQRFL